MTSCHFWGWNPWEWICVKRESFFDWSLGLGQTWCGKFFCFWFDQSESSFAEMPWTWHLANQRRRRSVRTRTIAPSPVILTNWLCQFSKLKIKLGVFPIQLKISRKYPNSDSILTWNMFGNLCWMLRILYKCIAWGDLVLLSIKILWFLQSGLICVNPLHAKPTKTP